MARVEFSDTLLAFTNAHKVINVNVSSYRDLVKQLDKRWPGIAEQLDRTAVAIDGQIYQDAWLEPIGEASEVYFLQKIEGG